jgi:hypothetical protein
MVRKRRTSDEDSGGDGDCVCNYKGVAAIETNVERLGYAAVCEMDRVTHHKSFVEVVQEERKGFNEDPGWWRCWYWSDWWRSSTQGCEVRDEIEPASERTL